MNRKQIRHIGADTIPRVTITLKNLPPGVGVTRPSTSSNTYIGRDDNNLLAEVIRGTLEQMGVERYDLGAAMLFHAINSMFPPEQSLDFRRIVAWGIASGASYIIEMHEVKHPAQTSDPTGEDEVTMELTVAPFPAFPPVVQPGQPQKSGPSKLWQPGDPI